MFEIKLPLFEGPFDLLLFFIERDELDIHDIPISKITQDFLAYLQDLETLNIEVASEFILVAATLMRIKAKMLLPRPVLDEQGQEIDPREELISHLLEYKKYKQAAEELAQLEAERLLREPRGNVLQEIEALLPKAHHEAELQDLDLYKLLKVYMKVMSRFTQEQNKPVHQIIPYPYTVEQQRQVIFALLQAHQQMTFTEIIAASHRNKIAVIFNFLAILDLLQAQKIFLVYTQGLNDFVITAERPTTAQA
ncbi:MAG: segregation and condensation protein A [Thermoflexibacteraceae bacterium]